MANDIQNILIGGEAGQGLVTIGEMLTKILVDSGYHLFVTKSYESRIRGGHNTVAIRFGTKAILAPQEKIDYLVALNKETVLIHRAQLAQDGAIVADAALDIKDTALLAVPYETIGEKRYLNTAALGIICSMLGIDEELVRRTVAGRFTKKDPEEIAKNTDVISKAYGWTKEAQKAKQFEKPEGFSEKPMIVDGNQALALGALSAGLRFYSFYPMTPSTSIALEIIKHADKAGVVVEQAEDEISVINMAIGASYAGAKSMVGTSGGGFALMVEGVSLAGMTETPIVIVVGQRPGPATGLPTRTEQADLDFVLHAGHGEFPRTILTPGSAGECFRLAQHALMIAEKYQSPVFILTDQFLADTETDIAPFATALVKTASTDHEKDLKKYERYSLTENGVSLRLFPGETEHLVIVDSDEHTEDGHITEDLAVRKKMVEKRLKKMNGIIEDRIKPELTGNENADLLFVTWGSSKGAALEAADTISSNGRTSSVLHFPQVWPLVADDLLPRLRSAKNVIVCEGNAFGQFSRLIRRETGFEITKKILRYDGLPITPEYILGYIRNEKW